MTFLHDLKRLMDAATKGPWFIERDDRPNMEWNNHILEEKGGTTVCFMAHSGNEDNSRHENAAELIAYLVNHAPALAELVEATKEYYDAQQEWAKYRLALDNAEANYSDSAPDEKLFMAAVLRVNKAEHALSEALAKLNANDGGKHEG